MHDPVEYCRGLETHTDRYDFFQALRLLEQAYSDQPRIGQSLRPRDDAVRLAQNVGLAFHPSALSQFTPASEGRPARLSVNFFGLLGADGPLPLHLTEYAYDRKRNVGDSTFVRFLDVFHHRMLSLFYRARAATEPTISLDRPDTDRFSDYVGSLFGMGIPALRQRDVVPDFAKLHFAGLLANRTRNASGLVSILQEFFQLPIVLEQCIGQWLRLPSDACTRIGALDGSSQLGSSTVLGSQVWDCQSKFRIVIGPLDYTQYCGLLPGSASVQRLVAWVRNYAGDTLDWDVRLILKKTEVPKLTLGGKTPLGWATWLGGQLPRHDDGELLCNPIAHAAQSMPERHL